MNLKSLFNKYGHNLVFLYALIYMPWFIYLEKNMATHYYVIRTTLDDIIPFCEYFIVPYLLWFPYMAITFFYFYFTDRKDFLKFCSFCMIGMTFFLLISTILPNGQNLRPLTFENNNIFTQIVDYIYATDTPTNVFPSIHVFNSIGAYLVISQSKSLEKYKAIKPFALVLTISIVLSTMFVKQHSVADVLSASLLSGFLYYPIYAKHTTRHYEFPFELRPK